MTTKTLIAIAMALAVAVLLGFLLPVPAHACKLAPRSPLCQPGQENCEPQCITTSDGAGQPYTDGRTSGWQHRQFEQRRQRARAFEEGRAAWQNNGTPSPVGTISPFVPGSRQDLAWKAERQRRGIQ